MKKRNLNNLKLRKQTVSNLNAGLIRGAAAAQQAAGVDAAAAALPTLGIICATIYSYLECEDITHTSKDYDGQHCDIATINDSCLSLCRDMCNDF